ncbi:CD209 antigen [Elysia marginata]|uniref:CD209 antigen n=1 Tax=Elysia marginata TaxID=1093978 RepID=A0AAV4JND3_9GAST|nr:CD209 antigen [Elysia marginata]
MSQQTKSTGFLLFLFSIYVVVVVVVVVVVEVVGAAVIVEVLVAVVVVVILVVMVIFFRFYPFFKMVGIGVNGLNVSDTLLTLASGSECQTEPLGHPWTSYSPAVCYWQCRARYRDTCQSVVFNTDTQMCTPGGIAFRSLEFIPTLVPLVHSVDTIYYAKQPIPPCDAASGNFVLFEVCGFTACIHRSTTRVNYDQAVSDCDQLGARLLMINTLPNYSVCRYAKFPGHAWVGLKYSDAEKKFMWINGEPLSDEQFQYIWVPGQPNNSGGVENCAEYMHTGINDISCLDTKEVICEPYA